MTVMAKEQEPENMYQVYSQAGEFERHLAALKR